MGKSARILGEDLDLNSQEMNQLLKDQGFLEGDPGAYVVTERGAPFANETDFHRGPGGYSWYNRDWTTRTWDEKILDELDVSPESIQRAKEEVAERRFQQREQAKRDQEIANRNFRATGSAYISPEDAVPSSDDGKYERIARNVGIGVFLTYGLYHEIKKYSPEIKLWWMIKGKPKIKGFFRHIFNRGE